MQDIQPTPEIVSLQKEAAYISGIARVGERVITILDLEKILTSDEIAPFVKLCLGGKSGNYKQNADD